SRDLNTMVQLLKDNVPEKIMRQTANEIRLRLNPHPAGQKQYNVPSFEGEPLQGVQHKYQQTVLIFPTAGQHCHAYCTFCFRWPQFVGLDDLKFATRESGHFQDYLREHKEVTDVLLTGGDPMTMKARQLALYIEPLLEGEFDHIQTIRIGTKSLSYWPHRYVTDEDADDLLRLFEKVVQQGKHLAIMAHYEHWRELDTQIAQKAIQRIRTTGGEIRTQAPVVRHINDRAHTWGKMWQMQVRLGCIPYYMFVERQTGAKDYFEIPLVKVWEIYRQAIQQVSGLGRTARGPVMSALPGKVKIEGISEIQGEKVFVLSFLQARNPQWCNRPFFASFDAEATWLGDLKPAFGESKFFYESELEEILTRKML
ncbi:lysine 2,3-aminomutase, partial [Moorena sp. SIO4A5]|uniref:KamA family radical SAM protein n=1 Tax=Moorena sp. SIO4A5 TaxID=2607838 RepID=UPI0013CB3FE8